VRVLGVDGYKKGWVAIGLVDGRFAAAGVAENFIDLLVKYAEDAEVLAIDMPLGLVSEGSRDADASARDSLPKGGAKSSVFPVPPRPVIELADWDEALALAKRIPPRKGITKQLFALMPRIREVDAHADDKRIHEIHPEVSFRRLADLHPEITDASLLMAKKTWRGQQHRRALLAAAGIHLPDELGEANCVPPDDVLDAAVAAWSASRIASSTAASYPAKPVQRDRSGRLIAIRA